MTNLQRYLVISWAGIAILVLVFVFTMSNWVLIALFVGAMLEQSFHDRVYSIAPTLQEYFSGSVLWKNLLILYGFAMSAVAIYFLTMGRDIAEGLGRHHMFAVFSIFLGPLIVPLAVHQRAVFRALGETGDT